ncbi:MAG: replication protein RepA [Hyphomicrobium sp.]
MEKHAGDIIVDAGREQRPRRQSRDPDGTDPLFQHALLCQLGLPRRHVKERVFERRSGAASLLLEAGRWYTGLNWEPQPLPYGTRPRIVLINLCAEAVRTKSRTVNVEHSVRAFLRRLNIDTSGYSMRGFKRQMIALSCCHMQLGFRTQRGVGQFERKPISRFEAWVSEEERQRGMWPGELELSQNNFPHMFDGATDCPAKAELPAGVIDAVDDLMRFSFGLLSDLRIRDEQYAAIHAGMTSRVCPFCGCEYFEAPGAPRHHLDHYLAISRYPFAGTNLRNLVPMGDRCNSAYKRNQDILFDAQGQRRRCFDPYGQLVCSVSLAQSRPFEGQDGRTPMWMIELGQTQGNRVWLELKSLAARRTMDS